MKTINYEDVKYLAKADEVLANHIRNNYYSLADAIGNLTEALIQATDINENFRSEQQIFIEIQNLLNKSQFGKLL